MPLAKPRKEENEQDFINRFMEENSQEFETREQALAVAYQQWENRNKKSNNNLEIKKYDNIDFKPTKAMADAAKRGLNMREKQPPSNRGGTSVGLARARQLINRENLSPDTVKRMYSFFSRHEVDKQSESWKKGNSKGEQAWLLWGGDPGFSWSKRKVEQIKKEDEKKGGGFSLERKSIQLNILEVKQEGDKGYFKAYLNTYGNVDLGNDITMPSFGEMNIGKVVPLLVQHEQGTEHGMLRLGHDKKGIIVDGTLFLEKVDGSDVPVFPEAYKTYSLLKRGVDGGVPVKFSMGYTVSNKEYENINGVQARKLIAGEIKEGSRVTFPMNEMSLQTNQVKEYGGVEEDMDSQEVKGMYGMYDMSKLMKISDYMNRMNRMKAYFDEMNEKIMTDNEMDIEEKVNMINKNVMEMMKEYPKACEDYMRMYHGQDGKIDMMLMPKGMKPMMVMPEMDKANMDMMSKQMYEKMYRGMNMMKAGYEEMAKAMMNPEMQYDPEDMKDPEGKKADEKTNEEKCDNINLETKRLEEIISNKLKGSE